MSAGITTGQFGSFDGRDNRRELMILMQKLGEKSPDPKKHRAAFLQGLIPHSVSALAAAPLIVNPDKCDPVGAYFLFGAITGCLDVPIEAAAKLLDEAVRKQ
ncbi:MAG: hypothetical protein K2X38_25480 [Gemmataceae bacterium]|nr:hypothetical protein [Gemmataceae bacterium]